MKDLAIKIIKEELERRGIRVEKIILFGSRARGDFKPDSDWDFLVVLDRELDPRQRREIIGEIKIKLAEQRIPNDLFIKSISQVEEQKSDVGWITYYALKYGVEL